MTLVDKMASTTGVSDWEGKEMEMSTVREAAAMQTDEQPVGVAEAGREGGMERSKWATDKLRGKLG